MIKVMSRKVNHKGGLTLPIAVRQQLSLDGSYVHVEVNDNGQIVLTPYSRECVFCGAADPQPVYKGIAVCQDCIKGLTSSKAKKQRKG